MRGFISTLLCLFFVCGLFTGCGSSGEDAVSSAGQTQAAVEGEETTSVPMLLTHLDYADEDGDSLVLTVTADIVGGTFADSLSSEQISFDNDLENAENITVSSISEDKTEAEITLSIPKNDLDIENLNLTSNVTFASGTLLDENQNAVSDEVSDSGRYHFETSDKNIKSSLRDSISIEELGSDGLLVTLMYRDYSSTDIEKTVEKWLEEKYMQMNDKKNGTGKYEAIETSKQPVYVAGSGNRKSVSAERSGSAAFTIPPRIKSKTAAKSEATATPKVTATPEATAEQEFEIENLRYIIVDVSYGSTDTMALDSGYGFCELVEGWAKIKENLFKEEAEPITVYFFNPEVTRQNKSDLLRTRDELSKINSTEVKFVSKERFGSVNLLSTIASTGHSNKYGLTKENLVDKLLEWEKDGSLKEINLDDYD